MTVAEKLRFLADRAEDGKEFYLIDLYMNRVAMKFSSYSKIIKKINGKWDYLNVEFNHIIYQDFEPKPQWEFTEDEKAILRNLPEQYRWIARDDDETMGELFIYAFKPSKFNGTWIFDKGSVTDLDNFKHLFQSIQWSNDEPCEFRKYL